MSNRNKKAEAYLTVSLEIDRCECDSISYRHFVHLEQITVPTHVHRFCIEAIIIHWRSVIESEIRIFDRAQPNHHAHLKREECVKWNK